VEDIKLRSELRPIIYYWSEGQKDKPRMHHAWHAPAREISHETAILRSSAHRIIHSNLQLKSFKRCRVQLLYEANRISRLTR